MVEKEVIDGSSCSKNGDDMFLERGMQPEEIGLLYDTGKDSRSKTNHRAKRCLRGRRFFIGCAEVVGWSCRAYLHDSKKRSWLIKTVQLNYIQIKSKSTFEYHGPQRLPRFRGMFLDVFFDFVLERNLIPMVIECDNGVYGIAEFRHE